MAQQNPHLPAQTPAGANPNVQQHPLTPATDTAPVVVNVQNELSGAQWVTRFPGSSITNDLVDPFRANVDNFISALRTAGATITISATLRPRQRAYLMHWSWEIVNNNHAANNIPHYADGGVDIEWAHNGSNGNFSQEESKRAARAMVNGYGMQNLTVSPALNSRHTEGHAIDMSISWTGTLTIQNASGQNVQITTTPRDGTNTQLAAVGATYNVIKFNVPNRVDRPHWSTDGR